MKLTPLLLGTFKLDGGAMFGVVPKSLWQKKNAPDENNMCTWALRLLLIEEGERRILIDTGMGHKQSEKFFGFYYREGHHDMDRALKEQGLSRADITDVFITHLHFDHVGGAVERDPESGDLRPFFPRARYWSNARHWRWATKPNAREKASFLPENIQPLEASGQLHFIDVPPNADKRLPTELGFDVLMVSGHTDAQMIPLIPYGDKTIVYMADLLPSVGHIPLAWVMGFDTRPLVTLDEKAAFLNEAADQGYFLFLEHDHQHEICTVKHTEKGVRLDQTHEAHDVF